MQTGKAVDRAKARPQTLCWSCKNAVGGCSWSAYKRHIPVPGWDAIPTKIKSSVQISGRIVASYVDSYIVVRCPQYINDKEEIEMPISTKWTPELIHDMQRLREEGMTVPQIAERLGIDAKAVSNKIAIMKKKGQLPAKHRVEANPDNAPEYDPILEELIFSAFDVVIDRSREHGLPIERHWRWALRRLEEQLAGCAALVRNHPDAMEYAAAMAAIVASDEFLAKETTPRDGSPDEAKG